MLPLNTRAVQSRIIKHVNHQNHHQVAAQQLDVAGAKAKGVDRLHLREPASHSTGQGRAAKQGRKARGLNCKVTPSVVSEIGSNSIPEGVIMV